MDKILHSFVNGAFAAMKGPVLVLLLVSIVLALARHLPAAAIAPPPQTAL
jgi:hypothetical protein